jgi:uncharacterized protein
MAPVTRIFFVADLHGSERCFRKFLNAAAAYRADVLLVGGDVAAKVIAPVFRESDGWVGAHLGQPRHVHTSADLERLEADLRALGSLPYRVERKEWEALVEDRPRADALFRELAVEQLTRWLELARERLGASRVRTFVGLGNDDFTEMEAVLADDPYVALTDERLLRIDDQHELLTIAYSNPTPWRTPRELPDPEIGRRIESWAAKLESPEQAIFNIHVPPDGTPLDLAPKLDAELTKVIGPGGEPEMVHVGSGAVRSAIERHQPMLGLHGHIHESKGVVRIGRTECVNPGSVYSEGVLQGAIVDIEPKRVRSYVLTTG